MFEGRTSCPETQTDDGVLSVQIANLSTARFSECCGRWSPLTHRCVGVLSPYITVLCTYVHLDGLIPARNENAPRRGCVHEAAASAASRNLLNGHIALLCIQFDTITGPFYFWSPEMAEQSDGRKQKTDASCHAPTRIKGRRSNFGSSAFAGCCIWNNPSIAQRSEGRQLFQPLPKVHTSFIKEWTETNPRSYLYIAEIWSRPHRGISGPTNGGMKRMSFQPSSILLPKGK